MSASEAISFRLSPQFAEQLQTGAMQRGMSKGDFARQLVIDGLTRRAADPIPPELSELPSTVRSVETHLTQIRQDINSNHKDVKQWLTQVFHRVPPDATQAVAEVNDQVHKLREDFATGLVTLLTHAAGWKVEDAMQWVQAKLLDH